MPFTNLSSTEATKTALHEWSQRIKSARSIVVAGAGLTGVELAGELGQEYALAGKKEITLICDKELPLHPKHKREVREMAKKELERLNVKIITNARATSATNSTITLTTASSPSREKRAVTATTTTTLQADLFIPTYGTAPNTSFLPAWMLDADGFVKQDASLRAEAHDNIFAVGDVGSLQPPQGVYGDAQAVYLARALDARARGSPPPPPYKPDERVMFGASIGRSKGVGQMGGWRVWGWLIALMKSRNLGTDWAGGFVRGDRTISVKDW